LVEMEQDIYMSCVGFRKAEPSFVSRQNGELGLRPSFATAKRELYPTPPHRTSRLMVKKNTGVKMLQKTMPPINPKMVQEKLTELNSLGHPGAPYWISPDGLNALTTMTNDGGVATFNPSNGIPLKIFVNTLSGEIKIFDARAFTSHT
jgi:hypothetical protein